MKKYMVADLIKAVKEEGPIKDNGINHIDFLLQEVEADRISLASAQEDAWAYYGYSEGGTKSGTSKGRWGEKWSLGQGTDIYVEVDYEPDFESLGDELDDTPIWTITRISIQTKDDEYPHNYNLSGKYEHEKESIDFLEENSPLKWFNRFVSDQRFGSK